MSKLDQIVNVQVTRQTQMPTQAGFGIPLILGPAATFPQTEIRRYTDLDGVKADFQTSDAEYVMASKLFSQSPRPEEIKIGKTSTAVAQVVTITPDVTAQEETEYTVTLDGQEYSFTSDATPTAAEVVTGLIAAINADADNKALATGTTTLILTAKVAGVSFTYAVGAKLAAVLTTPSNGIADDIAKAMEVDSNFYFLLTTSSNAAVIEQAADYVETLKRMYLFLTADADVRTNATTDIVSKLKAKSLFRSAVFYTKDYIADRGDAGWVGRVAPTTPGSENWANMVLSGITADKYTSTEEGYLDGKNANYYETIAGLNVTQNGQVVGGEYIDIIRLIDWVVARMQEAIFANIVNLDKLPFTDAGLAIIQTAMKAVLDQAVANGGIASAQDYTITIPKAKDIPAADKAARRVTGIKFSFVAAGAVNKVRINGTVTL